MLYMRSSNALYVECASVGALASNSQPRLAEVMSLKAEGSCIQPNKTVKSAKPETKRRCAQAEIAL